MRILMRMGMSPFENCSLYDVIAKDKIGTNAGNMLFPYSIIKNIYNADMVIDTYEKADEKDADRINKSYDMFLIPLANAFRSDFVGQLKNLTKLIKKLSIPCIVIGVGLQTDYEPDFNKKNSFDHDVLEFCHAVLEKSNSIGVRGEITAQYLYKLGIDKQYVNVIGCPSMYMYGDFIPLKKPSGLSKSTKISISYSGRNSNYFEFLEKMKRKYLDYYYILQKIYELQLLYAGDPVPAQHNLHKYYIGSQDSRSFVQNRIRMFINVPSWINFLSNLDLGVGSCIHGSIASVLAGNPTIVFAFDSRVRELAEYHNIPARKMSDITESTNIEDIYESTDFSIVLKGHRQRYENFLGFLKSNGIANIPEGGYNGYRDFGKTMEALALNCPEGVSPYLNLPIAAQEVQLKNYIKICDGKIRWCHREKEKGHDEKRINRILSQWEKSKKNTEENLIKLR